MISEISDRIQAHLANRNLVWLFLDYDGTLADFATTPDEINPDPELIALLQRLSAQPNLRLTLISGRRLAHVKELVPIPEIIRAGTYGIELQFPERGEFDRLDYQDIRPALDRVKPRWSELIATLQGFYLEDKDWALALHAKFAHDDEAEQVLAQARRILEEEIHSKNFRILGGDKFLEIGPWLAHKGETIVYLLDSFSEPNMLLVYIGDDDKDEEAFSVIHEHGGSAIVVASEPRPTLADYRLESPQAVRRWLAELIPED
jgi:trehalose-phosphatase